MDRFVPASYSWVYHTDPPQRGGPLYRIRGPGQTANEHAAVALGTARRALDAIVAIAGSKTRGVQSQVRLGSRDSIRRMIGESSPRLLAARLLAVDTWERAWATVQADQDLSAELQAEMRAAAAYATAVAVEVATEAFRACGGDALYETGILQRCLRDLNGAAQHYAVSDVALQR